jgi:hypothetical protein
MVAMLTKSLVTLSLVVRIYDAYGVSADHLAKARTTVDAIMQTADVAVTWPPCPCPSPVGSGELIVRILAASPASARESLGFSYVDLEHKAGTLATVFADRVRTMARIAEVDEGELLGRAIAHEIAHLLLGTRDHQHYGLMRGQWTTSELLKQQPSDWTLSSTERTNIRKAVARRSIESTLPAIVTADADPASDVSAQ